MDLLGQFSLLILGLVLIWKTGEAAVRNAVAFSLAFRVEKFAIGFTIFAISTCLPEISATVASSLQDVPELSAGNLMGSTLVNVSLVLGLAVIMAKKIKIDGGLKKKILRSMALIVVLLASISLVGKIHAFAGVLLILIFFGALFWFQVGIPKEEVAKEIHELKREKKELKKSFLSPKADLLIRLFLSLALLMLSSWLTVHSAAQIGKILNIGLSLFGATLISLGTSFTEFTLVIHSVKKREHSLALGDIFGASLVNLTLALGVLSILNTGIDITYAKKVLPFVIACIALVTFRLFRNQPITRKDGIVFIGSFVLYASWIFL